MKSKPNHNKEACIEKKIVLLVLQMIKNDFLKGSRYNIFSYAVIMLIIGLIMGLTGCTPMTTVHEDGSTVRHHFGYVKIISPLTASTEGTFTAMEISTYGLRLEKGVGFGYFHERNEYIPLDCRLVIRVANEQQLREVLKTLSFLEKEGLCVTVDSK